MGPLSLKKALLLLWLLLLPGEGTWYELNWWRIRFWGGRFFYFYLNGQGWEELTTNEVKSLQKAMEKDPAMGQYTFGEDDYVPPGVPEWSGNRWWPPGMVDHSQEPEEGLATSIWVWSDSEDTGPSWAPQPPQTVGWTEWSQPAEGSSTDGDWDWWEQNKPGEGPWMTWWGKNKKPEEGWEEVPFNPQAWEDWAEWQRDDEPVDGWDRYNTRGRQSDLRRLQKRALEREGLPVPQWLQPQPPLKLLAEQKRQMRELINKAKAMQKEARRCWQPGDGYVKKRRSKSRPKPRSPKARPGSPRRPGIPPSEPSKAHGPRPWVRRGEPAEGCAMDAEEETMDAEKKPGKGQRVWSNKKKLKKEDDDQGQGNKPLEEPGEGSGEKNVKKEADPQTLPEEGSSMPPEGTLIAEAEPPPPPGEDVEMPDFSPDEHMPAEGTEAKPAEGTEAKPAEGTGQGQT